MVGVEHLARGDDVGDVGGALGPRQVEHGVEPGADPAGFRALVTGAFELADLAQRGLADLVGQVGRFDAGAVVVGAIGLVLAELLADGGELLAEQELALALVHTLAYVVADLLADLELGQVLARPFRDEGETGGDVGGLEQLALLLVGQVRRVAGQVGELGRVADLLDGVDDLPGVAPLQDRDDDLLVVVGQVADGVGDRLVLDGLGLDPQRGAGSGDAGADPGAAAGAQHGGLFAAGQPADLLDLGDDAVDRVAVGQPRGQQQLAVRAGAGGVDDGAGVAVELDRHDHAGQHHQVGQRQDRKGKDVRHGMPRFLSLIDSRLARRQMFRRLPPSAASEQSAHQRKLSALPHVMAWGSADNLGQISAPVGTWGMIAFGGMTPSRPAW